MLWLESVVALSSLRTNCVGEPEAFVAAMLTLTVLPLAIVDPFAGLVICAPSADVPATLTVTTGGLVLLSPLLSSTVSETVYVPGFANVTLPGLWSVLVFGVPPGNTHQ